MEAEAVYLADMSKCLPENALSTTPTRHKWQVVDYDAGEISGNMVCAPPPYETPAITLPLNVEGWYAFSIGFWPGIEQEHPCVVKYKLSDEEVYTVISYPRQSPSLPGCFWDRTEIIETFPRYADLTGQNLVLSKQNNAYRPGLACIAYVKLVPLDTQEVAAIQRDREQRETRTVIAMNDGGVMAWTKAELLESVEPFRHSDVGKLLWGVNLSDLTHYHSNVGQFIAAQEDVYPRMQTIHWVESIKALLDQGVIPFVAAMEHAHELGLEFHTYYRMSIVDEAHPYFFLSTETTFLRDNPDCRMVDKDGTPMIKASFAFPKAREFMVSLIEEAMEYDIDGVNLCFIRGPEYVGYEQPVIDDFMRLYGEDPRAVADDDERLCNLKASYLTELVRAVRQVADKYGEKRGRKMQVSATFESGKENMRYLAYDAYSWVKEKLVDFIITSPPSDLVRLAKENGCQVYMGPPIAWLGDHPLESSILAMRHALAGDMDGVAIWDTNTTNPEMWSVCSRLGHRDELMDLREPDTYPKMKRFKLLSIRGRDFAHTLNRDVPSHFYGPHPGGLPEMLAIYTGG